MFFNKADFIQQTINSKLIHFDEFALKLYLHQLEHNPILKRYAGYVNASTSPESIHDIRFLPATFFRDHDVVTGSFLPEIVYTSSSTSGSIPARHLVADKKIYEKSYFTAFELFYGPVTDYVFLCLLPGYLERKGSSLIDMAQGLITASKRPESGFYLYDMDKLSEMIRHLQASNSKVFLLGVTFALLDFAALHPMQLTNTTVMETGGMKGRRQEQTREEIHQFLMQQFEITQVHSEYGMTELLSQAYSKNAGKFMCPPWMKVIITDVNDPFKQVPAGKTGIINVIDLANIDSCAFIQTQDLGRLLPDGEFEVLGRVDHSETRGCNLMYL